MKPSVLVTKRIYPEAIEYLRQHCDVDYVENDEGLTAEQLHDQLVWQLTVLTFIEQRFRAATLLTNEDLRSYYDQHLVELRRQYPQDTSFETLEPKIRASLEGERVNQNFTQWLEQSRKRYHIEYKQEAFQ